MSSSHVVELSYANDFIEICTVKAFTSNDSLSICGIYRPHSGTIEQFCSALESVVNNNVISNSKCVVAGDFNINLMSESAEIHGFVDMMRSNHYIQVITDVTHPGNDLSAPSLIDLIWTNQLCNYNSGIVKTGVTDHHGTFMQLPFRSVKSVQDKIKITFRDCSAANERIFENKLSVFDWSTLKSNDINMYGLNFISALNTQYQQCFPIKTKFFTLKYFKNPWYTRDVKKLTDARNKYHTLLLEKLISPTEYSRVRNKVTSLLRKCKENYYKACFSRNAGNIKATWNTIHKICNGSDKKSIEKISMHNNSYTNPGDIANIFNNFFVNVASDLANDLQDSTDNPYNYVIPNLNDPISLDPVTLDECSNVICALKLTKQDTNSISVHLFKKYHRYFLPTIVDLINTCFYMAV